MSRRFHLFLTVLVALTVIFSIYAAPAVRLTLTPAEVLKRVGLPLVPFSLIFYYRWRSVEKLKNLFVVAFWATILGCLYGLPVYIAARQKAALHDALLAHLDRRLGLEVPAVLAMMDHYPILKCALDVCYDSLIPLMILALVLPVLCDKLAAVKEYILANIVSGAIAIPLFAALPAVGPWHYYGYTPNAEQERTTRVFFALKSEDWYVLESANVAGVITFPSFHTILAILSALALWRIPYVRWLAALLACLILVSTVTTGWHYLVDVLAGIAIAAVSVAAVRGYAWLEGKMGGLPPTRRTAGSAAHELGR